jgi:hypothetical protein
MLCKQGPPMPLAKAVVAAVALAALLTAGVLMVPLLENYAFAGLLLTAVVLYAVFYRGLRSRNPLTMVLVMSFALMPVAGVADQALISTLSVSIGVGIVTGSLVGRFSHAFFPEPPDARSEVAGPISVDDATAAWIALRATLIVMPVYVLALTNPSLYLAAIMKTVALGQQASETNARTAGRELVGSTLMGAFVGACVWLGLSLLANLWMLTLWMMAAAWWTGSGMFGARPTVFRSSFWSNALVTALILLGPAIEDSANGKSVVQAAVVRTSLFVGVAIYAWLTVQVLERWRPSRSSTMTMNRESRENTA